MKWKKKCMLFVAIAIFASCSKEENMDVFVGSYDKKTDKYTELLNELYKNPESLAYPTALNPEDDYYKKLNDIVPSGTIDEQEYVDLGLSVRWAMYNVGAKEGDKTEDFNTYLEAAMKDYLVMPESKLKQYVRKKSNKFPYVLKFKEYEHSIKSSTESETDFIIYEKIKDNAELVKKAYNKAVHDYYENSPFLKFMTGVGLHWANIDSYAYYKDYNDLPKNISGSKKYDLATQLHGPHWRTPTIAEIKELMTKCKWEEYNEHGIHGYIITGPSGKKIFLPGDTENSLLNQDPSIYMSSETDGSWQGYGYGINLYALDIKDKRIGTCVSKYLYSIRPVCDKQ